jgi:transposase
MYEDEYEVRNHARLVKSALTEIADALGDVDGYTARFTGKDHTNPAIAAGIAERLLAVHRTEEAMAAREGLVKDRTALANRAKNLTLLMLKKQNEQRRLLVAKQIKAIDEAATAIINANPDLARKRDIIVSIKGLGTVTANQLVADMSKLGTLENKQAASLDGLAPVARQSGQWKGKSFIQGGRANVRQALYLPALFAIRFNTELKAKYAQLIAAGKPAKVAITDIMRKLVVMPNALLRDNRMWTESMA